MKKVAFLISHPIQYYSPFFKELSKHINLTVLYCSNETVSKFKDKEFQKKIQWDTNLLDGYDYIFLKNNSPISSIFNPPLGLINLGIKKEIQKYDAIIIHGWHYITNMLAIRYAKKYNIPYYIHSENPYNQEIKQTFIKRLIKKIILKPIFKQATGFFAIGTQNKRFYELYGVPKNKIHFTPYAVDNFQFKKTKIKPKRWPTGKVLLFVGKLIPKKRPFDVLKAYEKLNKANASLVFVGTGKLKPLLEKYTTQKNITNVYFYGFVNQKELKQFYSHSDIFILPSQSKETWGLVINEAMNFGLPIIASDTVGCAIDLVKNNGFIYPVGDIEKLKECCLILLENDVLRKKMGENSKKIIHKWTHKVTCETIQRVLAKI